MTLCNMVVEAGGKNGVVAADRTTFEYLEGKTSQPYEAVYSDDDASYYEEYRFDVSKLEPVVAKVSPTPGGDTQGEPAQLRGGTISEAPFRIGVSTGIESKYYKPLPRSKPGLQRGS